MEVILFVLSPNSFSMLNYNISVAIVEDQSLVRSGFRRLLTSFGRVTKVYEAANGKELIDLLSNVSIDIVLLDLSMPVMDGEQTCIFLKQHYPSIKILILSMYDDRFRIERMIRLGANGFLNKNVDIDEVEDAIYCALDKGFYSNELVERALNQNQHKPYGLTERELEIINLICEELTMREISAQLMISEKTVQNHRSNIMAKLGVTNTAGLAKFAAANGLIKIGQ